MKYKFRRITALILVFAMCLSVTHGTVFAEELIVEDAVSAIAEDGAVENVSGDAETAVDGADLSGAVVDCEACLEEEPVSYTDEEAAEDTEELSDEEAEAAGYELLTSAAEEGVVIETKASDVEGMQEDPTDETVSGEDIIIEEISVVEEAEALDADGYQEVAPISVTHINPLYRDVITEEDLEEPDPYGVSLLDADAEYLSKAESAVGLRTQMKKRLDTISILVAVEKEAYGEQILYDIFDAACVYTGEPDEGDYLLWHYAGWKASVAGYIDSDTSLYCLTVTYTVTYYTTLGQEEELDSAVDSLENSLGLNDSSISDFRKIKNIYDYICDNVTYDYTNLNVEDYKLKFTAYAALMNKTAVCQGYALLFYRLALEAGIDARLIPGTGGGGAHGWNIVKIGDYYYNLDATWDAGKTIYDYFLKCPSDFSRHTRDEEYDTSTFHTTYPMREENYSSAEYLVNEGWILSGETLIITANVENLTSTEEQPWIGSASLIQKVIIDDGVIAIGDYAFAGCTALTEIIMPDSVASISTTAFSDCTALSVIWTTEKTPYSMEEIAEKGLSAAFESTEWYNHEHSGGTAVEENREEATCEAAGSYDLVTYCTKCQNELTRESKTIDAKGHTAGQEVRENEVAATCEAGGSYELAVYCSVCKEEIRRETKYTDRQSHTPSEAEIENEVAATCETGGSYELAVYCSVCEEEISRETKTTNKLAHIQVTDTAASPTCTTPGKTTGSHCLACGEILTVQQDIPATGHTGEWVTVQTATISVPEQQERICTVCGDVEMRSVGETLKPFISFNVKSLRMKKGQTTTAFKVSYADGDSIKKLKTNKKKMISVSAREDGSLKIKALKKTGTVKLTVTLASGQKKQISIKIVSGKITTSSLKISPTKKTISVREVYRLQPIVKPITSQDKVTYTSSNKKVATVTSKGVVKGKKKGTAKITIRSGKKKVVFKITVKEK